MSEEWRFGERGNWGVEIGDFLICWRFEERVNWGRGKGGGAAALLYFT